MGKNVRHRFAAYMMTLCIATACAGGKGNQWDELDYAPVYKAYEKRLNDSGYVMPSVIGCVDEDRHNCNQ